MYPQRPPSHPTGTMISPPQMVREYKAFKPWLPGTRTALLPATIRLEQCTTLTSTIKVVDGLYFDCTMYFGYAWLWSVYPVLRIINLWIYIINNWPVKHLQSLIVLLLAKMTIKHTWLVQWSIRISHQDSTMSVNICPQTPLLCSDNLHASRWSWAGPIASILQPTPRQELIQITEFQGLHSPRIKLAPNKTVLSKIKNPLSSMEQLASGYLQSGPVKWILNAK